MPNRSESRDGEKMDAAISLLELRHLVLVYIPGRRRRGESLRKHLLEVVDSVVLSTFESIYILVATALCLDVLSSSFLPTRCRWSGSFGSRGTRAVISPPPIILLDSDARGACVCSTIVLFLKKKFEFYYCRRCLQN